MKEGFIRGMSARASKGFRCREFWWITAIVMTLMGLIIVPFDMMERTTPGWMHLAFKSVPFYLSLGVVAAGGVLFGKVRERIEKGESIDMADLLQASAQRMILALSLGLFFLVVWTALWFLIGFVQILKEIPGLGLLLDTIFVWIPFVLHLLNSGLKTISLFALFILIPIITHHPKSVRNMLLLGFNRSIRNIYESCVLILFSFIPVLIMSAWMWNAQAEMVDVGGMERGLLAIGMRHVGMIPVMVLLGSPVLIFWYSFLFETHKDWAKEE